MSSLAFNFNLRHCTLEWKPPSTCMLYADSCLNALNPESCLKLGRDDMPWQPIKPGKFPWIECRTAFAAEVGRRMLNR
jgi:hypothetical protein